MRKWIVGIIARALGITIWIDEVRYGKKPNMDCDPAN